MSSLADIEHVRRALADCFGEFTRAEQLLRAELSSEQQGKPTQSANMLERRTRRFAIDGILRAFGWDASDPTAVREEARAFSKIGDPLYFDYLGLASGAQAPVLIVEAKGADIDPPRYKNGAPLNPRDTAAHLANEISIVKGSGGTSRATAEWRRYLADLQSYVQSLGPAGGVTLRRVVITTGKWLVVIRDPSAVFVESGMPDAQNIHFFASVEDMQADVETLCLLLHRQSLVDDIPLLVSVSDALHWMQSTQVTGYLRATLIATTTSGARRRHYPTRSIYAALAIETGNRWFVVVDYDSPALEEKTDVDDIAPLLDALQSKGAALELRMRSVIGPTRAPRSLAAFAGLPESPAFMTSGLVALSAEPGSSAAMNALGPPAKRLVAVSGEIGTGSEFVVVTGEAWFYKLNVAKGHECAYHFWRAAKDGGVTSDQGPMPYAHDSFTRDAQDRHCAHGDHRSIRRRRCHLDVIETHLCCRACVFEQQCWGGERSPPPCPVPRVIVVATTPPHAIQN